jgi:hypothetical protein
MSSSPCAILANGYALAALSGKHPGILHGKN